jgi:hypothetical protein
VCSYLWQFAHWAMSLLCLDFSNFFALLYVFDIEYILVIRGRLSFDEKYGEWDCGSVLLDVPNICDQVT